MCILFRQKLPFSRSTATAYGCACLAMLIVMYTEGDVLQTYRLSFFLSLAVVFFYDAVSIAGYKISKCRMNGER
jgi:hypothetical protein